MDNLICEKPLNPNSFSFCGIPVEEIGLEYAPDNANTYVYKPAAYKQHEETWDGHDGGYYYGTTTQPKDFILRCYFEQTNIKDGLMFNIYNLFRRGRTGKLIFFNRPWLWYNATVADVDISQLLNRENGIVTIKLRAYYPFARCDSFYVEGETLEEMKNQLALIADDPEQTEEANELNTRIEEFEKEIEDKMNNSNLLSSIDIVPAMEFEDITEQKEILLYNPGTETSQVIITMQGNAPAGFTIGNATTGKLCKFIGLSDAVTTDVNKVLVCNSINGKTYLMDEYQNTEYAFLYHDRGFLELPPSEYIIRNIDVSYEEGSNIITLSRPVVYVNVEHKYIFANGEWVEIVSQPSTTTLVLRKNIEDTGSNTTDIIDMNKIIITPVDASEFNLTQLKFTFNPTFA